WYVQGYLHAKYRLWQMEFQTIAASGRISEKLGNDPRFLRFDREQRRLGMVHAAELATQEIQADQQSRDAYEAYAAGVNAYIYHLTEASLPLEYKILNYKPERWSVLKSALFLKQMSKTLAGHDRDLEFTNMKNVFSEEEMSMLFPQVPDALVPIVPEGTGFAAPGIIPVKPASADSLYFKKDSFFINAEETGKPDRNNGSNSWIVNGSKTKSGAPILANDPHLELSLPSIWYEIQITTPNMNVYGASFPGTPCVIIGFNDNVAFGFTNAQRDVKDYYYVEFKDDSKKEYWFNNTWQAATLRIDTFRIKGAADFYDTVAYTVFGPVMYDQSFSTKNTEGRSIAVKWTAQEPSNEGLMWIKLNQASSYSDFESAIKTFKTPGQNMGFASKSGDIALWQQAKFPARWKGQGSYIMPGADSSYMWQGYIPQVENPHVINPSSGFIQSANQRPVDSTYPYFIPGNYITARGVAIHRQLDSMQGITPSDMMKLQLNVHSVFAEGASKLLLQYVNEERLDEKERAYVSVIRSWDHNTDPNSTAPTIFQTWWDSLEHLVWYDEISRVPYKVAYPDEQTLYELLIKDSAMRFVDNINTPHKDSLQELVTLAIQKATATLATSEAEGRLAWWKHKSPTIYHILKDAFLPFGRTGLEVGGWSNTINAITTSHGPSWRMIVHLTDTTEAFGIY
ncbi:MAG: penicillin acylase family protein, partial [Flavisolibacter sp.]|nr:penicillin acylase family protein [Flavisolibacter sp.]